MRNWLHDKLVTILLDDWRRIATHSWSFQLALVSTVFWGIIGGLILVWDGFEDLLPKSTFILVGVGLNVAISVARLTKQPGSDA